MREEPGIGPEWLCRIILVDIATAFGATVFIVVIRLTVVPSSYLTLTAAMVAASGIVMAAGLPPLRRGHIHRALLPLAVANWAIAVAVTTVVTFAWPLMMLAASLPSVLAAAIITGRTLCAYLATSVVASLAVVLVGLLQDFSGISEEVPDWLRDVVLIVFAPFLIALLALMVLYNSVSMRRVIAAVSASRAELAEQADELRRSRARVVTATDVERKRIERDLHDGAQQRLIAIGIGMSRARELCASDPAQAARQLEELRRDLRVAHDELRDLAQGVYPPVLTEHGLQAALQSAADRCPLPVTVSLDEIGRYPADVEAALYFCCAEALQNAVKHSRATKVLVSCGLDGSDLWVEVCDDGVGFDPGTVANGNGLANIGDRLRAIGGFVVLKAGSGRGVSLRGAVPLG